MPLLLNPWFFVWLRTLFSNKRTLKWNLLTLGNGQYGRVRRLQFTSTCGHTNITSNYRAIIDDKDQQKRFSTIKDIKKEPQLDEKGGESTVQSKSHTPGGQPTNRRKIKFAEVLPKERGAPAPGQTPQPEGPAPGR